MRMFEITGLKSSTQYEIKIAAVNSVGTGPFTNKSIDAMTLGNMQPFTSSPTNNPTASITPNNEAGKGIIIILCNHAIICFHSMFHGSSRQSNMCSTLSHLSNDCCVSSISPVEYHSCYSYPHSMSQKKET